TCWRDWQIEVQSRPRWPCGVGATQNTSWECKSYVLLGGRIVRDMRLNGKEFGGGESRYRGKLALDGVSPHLKEGNIEGPKNWISPLISGGICILYTPPEPCVCRCSFRLRKEVNV